MANEGLTIDPTSEDAANVALNLGDGTTTFLMEVDYPLPDLDSMYQSSVDTEGDPLVQQRYRNRTVTAKVRVDGASASAVQTTLGYMQQKIGKLNREGGTIVRTAPSGSTIAFDVIGAKIDIPVDYQLIYKNRSVVSLSFECKPFGRGTPITNTDHVETTLPWLTFTETGITGDVPALGRLVVDEDQGQNQYTAIWGVQSRYYDSASSAALAYQAESLTYLGLSPILDTAVLGYSGTGGVRAQAVTGTYVAFLSSRATGGGAHWSHVGDFRVYVRAATDTITDGVPVNLRARWGIGDSQVWTYNDEAVLTNRVGTRTWSIVDLGPVSIPKAVAGTQRWELQLLASIPTAPASGNLTIDWIMLVPTTEGSGVASAIEPPIDYGSVQAEDRFEQGAGTALAGKTPNTGGNWSGTGDADDFITVASPATTATRSAVSDAGLNTQNYNGRLETMATPSTLAGLYAELQMYTSAAPGSALPLAQGMLLRYVDANNFLAILAKPGDAGSIALSAWQRIAGTYTQVLDAGTVACNFLSPYTLGAKVAVNGQVSIYINGVQIGSTGASAALASGGTLDDGKVGIIDHYISATALTRTYENFVVYGTTTDAAVYASQSMEARSDRMIREDSGGTLWQNVSSYEGDYHLVPVAGREGRTTRYIVKLSRGAIGDGIDGGIDDVSARLTFTPRFLVVPE